MGLIRDLLTAEVLGKTVEVECHEDGTDIHYHLFIDNVRAHRITSSAGSTSSAENYTLRGKIKSNDVDNLVVVKIEQPVFSSTKFKLEVNGREVSMRKVR